MTSKLSEDHSGNAIHIGDKVRLLSIDTQLLSQLSVEEQKRVQSMVGEVFTIHEFDEYGHPWIEKWFGNGISHSIALMPDEIEKVTD